VRSKCCLYREAARFDPPHRIYTRTEAERRAEQNETFEGAVVVDPEPGLYERPTNTLDWASLYPSIMVTYNFCFSTLVADDYDLTLDPDIMGVKDPARELSVEERERRAADAVYTVDSFERAEPFAEAPAEGAPRFLKQKHKVGLVVHVLLKLLAWRKSVKEEMTAAFDADDVALGALLNQRQTAIKLLCNSIYGIFGATISFAYCQAVSASVTARGRALLYKMRWIAMDDFREHQTRITYGDTVSVCARARSGVWVRVRGLTSAGARAQDSIFVYMGACDDIVQAAELGVQMAAHITAIMKRDYTVETPEYNILNLEFEKTFRRILLIAKKRYAGLKYEYAKGKLTAKPGDCVPTLSGLESKRRDVTLMIKERVVHVLSLLLDHHYSVDENLRRTREYVWRTMVRPLLANKMDLRQLAITKALRALPEQYAANNPDRALPVHVQLAGKLIKRAGGEDQPNAPRAGDRLPFVIVRGEPGQSVSERAEDPVYAFEHSVPIDADYYLEKHVRATLLRLFVPVMQGRSRQTQLGGAHKVAHKGGVQFGQTDAARKRHNEYEAAEFLFGHKTEYRDRFGDGDDIEPVTERNSLAVREKSIAEGAVGVVPVREPRRGDLLFEVRYNASAASAQAAGSVTKRGTAVKRARGTLFAFSPRGARCRSCRRFERGAADGFVCDECALRSPAMRDRTLADARRYALDIEDLRSERRALAETCHECMGCADAPQHITCENSDCPVFWRRKRNQRSQAALGERMRTARDVALLTGGFERLSLRGSDA